ncbi:MAG TPA: hypothetical protein VE978_00645 [Chitinophagales bacterium]|nr:hypothetical protein [Chitinophagales bacterium]
MEENKDIENIDELSRSVIEPFEMNPPAGAWDALDAELTKKQAILYKKRASRFKLLSITLALLLFSFIIYHYFSLTQDSNRSRKIIGKTLPNNYNKSNAIINSDNNDMNSAKSPHSSEKIISLPRDSNSNSTSGNLVIIGKKKEPAPVYYNNDATLKKTEVQLAANEVERTSKQKNNELTSDEKQDNTGNHEIISVGTDLPGSNEKKSDAYAANAVHNESPVPSDDSQKNDLRGEEPIVVTSNLSGNSAEVTGDTAKPAATTPLLKQDSATDSSARVSIFGEINRITSRVSVAAFYAPGYIINHWKDNAPNDAENISEYKGREQSEYSFSTGLSLRYDLNSHWSILTGGTFSTLAYSMTYSTIYVKYGWDNQLHIQYPTSCGIIEVPNSGNSVLHDGDSFNVKVTCAQLVKFINVPLMVRYQVTKNRFTWYANTGVSANFMIQELVKVSFGTFKKTIVNNIDGLKKVNYGFLVGAGSQYNFNNGLGIFIEPVIKGSITSLTHKTPLNCYPYSFGLNAGISLHF